MLNIRKKLNGESLILSTWYWLPSPSSDELDTFHSKFKDNLFSIIPTKLFLIYILGDFNAKPSRWCVNDKSFPGGLLIESSTSYYGLIQIINDPTHPL